MKYVIGVDLGTSAVKLLLVNQLGEVVQELSKPYPIYQEQSGYSEQDPEDWVEQTMNGLSELLRSFNGNIADIEGMSFSGQMHGLVLLDEKNNVLRKAILWNDTRTTKECEEIEKTLGQDRLLNITKNLALEGFTLPKMLWVKKHEPDIFQKAASFVLPKDYVRYRLTHQLHMEYSDAAGTLLLEIGKKKWSEEVCKMLNINPDICPPLISSHTMVGTVTKEVAQVIGLHPGTKVFAGGADNACGAIGAGVLTEGKTLASIGTSGVVLSCETRSDRNFDGKVHYFNHAVPERFYVMGVTLAAGHSLSWFKETFAKDMSYEELLREISGTPIGSKGLLFTPYIVGERSPHVDAKIRGSFIGIDAKHERRHFTRAVLEGITFSLHESIETFRNEGKIIEQIVSIGGGAKNEEWLQMQADIFNAEVIKLHSEQGPGMGAAMLAAFGCEWFSSLQSCAEVFLKEEKIYEPIEENVEKYRTLFPLYRSIYPATKNLSSTLLSLEQI